MIPKLLFSLIYIIKAISIVHCYEKDITFTVEPGKTDCFFQEARKDDTIYVEYQVIDGSHGELDISFQLADPLNRILVADYKKPENSHQYRSNQDGDYRFCFDNTFSTYSAKTVYFDLMIEPPDAADQSYEYEDSKLEAMETDRDTILSIVESVAKIRDNVSAAKRIQELLSAKEARDRNLAEEMNGRVQFRGFCQVIFMVALITLQVFFIKHLFDEDKRTKFWKYIPESLR